MKDRTRVEKLAALPLIFGIGSFLAFALYLYSANHAPYTFIDVILPGPVLSFAGVIVSIITRKSRQTYPTLWTCGFIICLLGFTVCVLIIVVLAAILNAIYNGTWT